MSADPRPVLFVTNHAPPFRVGAFRALHEREDVVFALIGGDVRHGGGAGGGGAAVPGRCARASAASRGSPRPGAIRAVVAGLSGRVALPAAYARRAPRGRPVRAVGDDLGASAHPRARALLPAAARTLPPRRRDRDLRPARLAPTCAPRARRGAVVEAPQSVDDAFWAAPAEPERRAPFQALFAGRLSREKGVCVLLQAWPLAGLSAPAAALVLVGDGPIRARAVAAGAAHLEGPRRPSGCATSTRAATLWSCRRSPRATSWSRGGSSSTKPSTRESP